MIVVIADDFTGASEIGGVGIRNGFEVVIDTKIDKNVKTDILIIATNTRSLESGKSQEVIKNITKELMQLHPKFIYKKFDSLLRGNVGLELMAQLEVSSLKRALLVPANPNLNRTIVDGVYLFDGIPLMESTVFKGQLRKIDSSNVMELIGSECSQFTHYISSDAALPESGLLIGNTQNQNDLIKWAKKINDFTLPAGGSGFFDAILKNIKNQHDAIQTSFSFGEKVLYVSGSAFIPTKKVVKNAKSSGEQVFYMPKKIFCKPNEIPDRIADWSQQIISGLNKKGKVVMAIDIIECEDFPNLSTKIREIIADVVKNALEAVPVDELVIEGGATAYSIITKLQFERFYPTQELAPGVIRMKVRENERLHLTLKPGSYKWPLSIWPYEK